MDFVLEFENGIGGALAVLLFGDGLFQPFDLVGQKYDPLFEFVNRQGIEYHPHLVDRLFDGFVVDVHDVVPSPALCVASHLPQRTGARKEKDKMTEMNQVVISAFGGPEVLTLQPTTAPQPDPGDIVVKVAGAGINGPDLLQRRGLYVPTLDNALRPGLEVSGIVEAVGEDAGRFKPGDRVVALVNGGGYAEYVAVPETQVLNCPRNWRLADAAALPETFFTIEQTLVRRAGLSPDMTVLVHGASGGLGGTAIQVARHFGAKVIACVSSEEKAKYALGRGADNLIAWPHEDIVARVLELTGGRGVDRIVDIVGGDMVRRNIEMAAPGGVILELAYLGGAKAEIVLPPILSKGLTLIGSVLGPQPVEVKAEIARALEKDLWPALDKGEIGPPRIRHFALAEAGEAHRAMEEKDHYGKIVLVTPFGLTAE
jgi:NADPH:quinone reductase